MKKQRKLPAWTTAIDTIQQDDCLVGLAKIPDESVDLVFADPPFNIGETYDAYHDKQDPIAYLRWTASWLDEAVRVLKPTGSLWICISEEYVAEIKIVAERRFSLRPDGETTGCGIFRDGDPLKQRHHVIWYYTFGVNSTRKLTRSKTHLLHFVKSLKKHKWNPMAVRVASARETEYKDKRVNSTNGVPLGRLPDDTWMIRPVDVASAGGFKPDHDVVLASRVCGTFKDKQPTPNQMPEQIVGRIIGLCTDPGDLVVSPFCGSGTDAAVAKKLDRRFLTYEISPAYAIQAMVRLSAVVAGDMLDQPEPIIRKKKRSRD